MHFLRECACLREVCGGVVRPQVHVFKAVDGEHWQVLGLFAQVVERMRELCTVCSQEVDAT